MKIRLKVHYHTVPGQNIYVCGTSKTLGKWNLSQALKMNYSTGGHWSVDIDFQEKTNLLEYKYVMMDNFGNTVWEWGANRKIHLKGKKPQLILADDTWQSPSKEAKPLYTSAFTRVVMHPGEIIKPTAARGKQKIEFRIQVPRVETGLQVCVLGNHSKLGNWHKAKPLLLDCADHFPLWKGSISISGIKFPLEYKYGLYDPARKEVIKVEEGINRFIADPALEEESFVYIKSDEGFRHLSGNWRGAGVAVPVFSLKSASSFGVGDFKDLMGFIDWAEQTNLKMVQILPINETIASHNWLDSYPYKSISVMALHPIYLNLESMGLLKDKKEAKKFKDFQKKLNAEPYVDYPGVMTWKSRYYKLLFDQEKDTFFDSTEYKAFFETNKSWLVPYAAFVFLRDKMKSPDFRQWGKYSVYNKGAIDKLCSPDAKEWEDIAIHFFLQYHLDKQMREAAEYARNKGIVLKGDIPIGISPNSVEAWTEPHLFNLNAQAGAPPDDFAVKGQNWGFPTYNWVEMAKEDYAWWKNRLQKMADYFDAYRIDHILGFFRIWEIPMDAVEGTLGYFNPALPLTAKEIESYGIPFDYERMVKPYIRHHHLHGIFGIHTEEVIHVYLNADGFGAYKMKPDFDTQLKVNQYFLKEKEEEALTDKERLIRNGLLQLIGNVLFIQTGQDEWHPRITFQNTTSFAELDGYIKHQLEALYVHFFYERHDDFWYQKGMEKLPAIISASNMLVCGEDLGMVPDCVPPVMDQLGILSLEIQRMSKDPKVKFAHPADAPYLSVCTTSTHDMPTIRGWWEENRETIQEFFNNELGNYGQAPFFAEPWVCEEMIVQHLYSPAMWTTFPIQDLLAIDGDFRWNETHLEQINDPSNVRHKWRYRMYQTIDDLKKADKFNDLLKNLVARSGR
jgi:4-alpha-glucanotransferase